MKSGLVYLIGAGPGDAGLISEKALKILARADCVIYDYLAGKSLVENLKCEKIFVGKKGSEHTMPQEEINRLLVEKAKEGKLVARLKGGDPFIFGRGGEEAEELLSAGIRFRVVPGISSFYSAPAYAGIPVTHRDYANSFEVITGHRRGDSPEEEINFPEFDPQKTFIFIMGMKNLDYISRKLISEKSFPEDYPAGVVSWGTTPAQLTVTGVLGNIAGKAKAAGIGAPAIIVIGRVVLLRDKLRWFEDMPLFGKRIAVTRTREQASVLAEKLSELGADAIEFPTIELKRKNDLTALVTAIDHIEQYDWIIFTSQNAVNIFFDKVTDCNKDARCLHKAKIAAIGPATANELRKYFIKPDLVPEEFIAEGILREIIKFKIKDKRILLPCATEARPALKDGLLSLGAKVERIEIYDTIVPDNISEDALSAVQSADMITFASSSTVKNFFKIVKKTNAKLACIGPITADALKALGYTPDVVASEYTIDGLVEAIVKYYAA
ncbi:MAG: uroporphyrinogen-III C-methyltransferase [Spirochaetota bacterium]